MVSPSRTNSNEDPMNLQIQILIKTISRSHEQPSRYVAPEGCLDSHEPVKSLHLLQGRPQRIVVVFLAILAGVIMSRRAAITHCASPLWC